MDDSETIHALQAVNPDPPFLYDSLIKVIVGPEEQSFDIHKGLACHRSEFFTIACNGDWVESDGVVNLPEQDVHTFKYFVHWLHMQKLGGYFDDGVELKRLLRIERKLLAKRPKTVRPALETASDREYFTEIAKVKVKQGSAILRNYPIQHLVHLYILTDELLVWGLKDTIIDRLFQVYYIESPSQTIYWNHPSSDMEFMIDAINTAHRVLPESSGLPTLLLQMYCRYASTMQVARSCASLDHALLVQAFITTQSASREPGCSKSDAPECCLFHDHDAGPCFRQAFPQVSGEEAGIDTEEDAVG